MRIAHSGDWHLALSGSKLASNGRNARLEDRYRCARFTIEDAVNRGAQLIVHCGDVGDAYRWTPTIARLVKAAFQPAREADIDVVLLLGNHDMARSPSEGTALEYLRELPGVHVVEQPCLLDVWRTGTDKFRVSPSAADHQRSLGDTTELQLAAIPYPNASLLLRDEQMRNLSPGDRNLEIRSRMMDVARGLAADRLEGVPRLLLGHFAMDTAEAGKLNSLAMLSNEFTLNTQELASLGFDLVLLGHYHRRQVLCQEPWIGYCGSPEACNFGEEADGDKGYFIHAIGSNGIEQQFVETPYRRLVTLSADDFIVKFENGEVIKPLDGAIVRFDIPADSTLTVAEVRKALEEAGAFEARVTQERAESERHIRASDLTHGMALPEQLNEWLKLKPQLQPLTEALIAEALKVEAALGEGGAS